MTSLCKTILTGSLLIGAAAQEPALPPMQKGISVQMPVAKHAAPWPGADQAQAIVIAITADGKLFTAAEVLAPTALSSLSAKTIYVKADARAPFQTVLTVLDALHGKSVVLLAASPANAPKAPIVPPYGLQLAVGQ